MLMPPTPGPVWSPEGQRGALSVPSEQRSASIKTKTSRLAAPGWLHVVNGAIFISGLILVCGLSALIGVPAPLHSFAHDMFFLLDNAYRVVQGQVPHRDFSSAWGPIIYLIYATGLMLSGMLPTGIGYANALFGAMLAIWAFFITRSRWTSTSASVVGLFTILLITAPFSLGDNPRDFGFAMTYNRYGYAIFGIIILECASVMLGKSDEAISTDSWIGRSSIGAMSSGFALGFLAFLKISYAMVAVVFVAGSIILDGPSRVRRIIGVLSGFGIVAVLILSYLRFDLSDMFQDLAIAAASRRLALQVLHPISAVDLVQVAAILVFVAWRYLRARVTHTDTPRLGEALFALMTVGAGYSLLISNAQTDTFPLNGYAAVALAAGSSQSRRENSTKWQRLTMGSLRILLVGVCILPLTMENGISLAAATRERLWPRTPDVVSLASTERGAYLLFRPAARSESTGAVYTAAVEDGLELLRRHSGDNDGVLAFDEFNPFNYLLDRPSPRGGLAATAYNYIFSDASHPTAGRFFGNTRYVMVRKYRRLRSDETEVDDVAALMRIYGPTLQSEFTVVAETEDWVLWQRRQP
jgi:hypothetical protein